MASSPGQGDLKRSRGPESSLTWCLAHLSKPGPGSGSGSGTDCGRELDRKGRLCQWRALLAIRTEHIKGDKAGITRFRSQGGLRPLLELLRQPQCSRKTLDLALSILANCCTEPKTRQEVRKLDGVEVLAEILKRNVALETVQNRAARALGNLAVDPDGSAAVHLAGVVPLLLVCVSLSSGPSSPSTAAPMKESCPKLECAQSAVRALLYLSDTPPHRLALLTQGAMTALAPLLATEFPSALRRAALRTLHELTRGCGPECAREVSRSGVLTQLGTMVAPGEANGPFEELALKTLANMCSQGCLRPLVGSLGVIDRFAQEARKEPPKSGVFLKALCLCCKEAVNRAKVKEGGGLEVLTGFLAAHRRHPLARLAILACVDFVFDETAMEQLQELGLVPLLVGLLVELAGGDQAGANRPEPSPSSPADLLPSSCFESFDFPPPPDGCKREEVGREQGGLCSSSFLSLRSWLLAEGLISSEGDLLDSSGVEGEWGGLHLPPSSSPQTSTSTSSCSPNTDSFSCCSTLRNPCPSSASKKPSPSPGPSSISGPSPSPSPGPSPSKFSSPNRRRQRVPLIPSLATVTLEAPPLAPRPSLYHHPYHPEPWTPESPILLLLSRFSHSADPSAALVSSGAAAGLLCYLSLHPEPSGRCLRLLHRLSCNPNCLQALLRTGAAALIQHHLCRGGEQAQQRQSERVRAKVRQLGLSLLSNLRVQCESAFGAGVLTHVMLSGSDTERMNCALSLPLISSNKPLLKRLLVDGGGLLLALQRLGRNVDQVGEEEEEEEEEAKEEHNAECDRQLLSDWSTSHLSGQTSRFHSLYCSLLVGCLSGLGRPPDKKRLRLTPPLPTVSSAPFSSSPPLCKRPRLAEACPYSLATFDLVLLLDDGTRLPASRGHVVGAAGDGGSEYFRGLLSSGFGEARAQEDIRIKDVSPDMLLPVLHFLHGCRLAQGGGAKRGGALDPPAPDSGCCQVLDRLFSPMESQEAPFQDSTLGQAMMGASRFLVPHLQGALEELGISLLLNSSWSPESAEENLAARTSELELMEASAEGEKVGKGEARDGGASTSSSTLTPRLLLDPAGPVGGARAGGPEAATGGAGGLGARGGGALARLLPQLYCFSQRHSYTALGRTCLSLLLAGGVHQGELLRRLAREAHCVEALRQDLLTLATATLS